ncbi:MAG: alpha-glucosidase [Micavibrio sp.]|nr:alpha-glucosidase [Micavibrio sp.]
MSKVNKEWWRGAVLYQIYPRSFADTNADGIGDLPGITSHLDHLANLGVDAVWISPFFKSPMKDFGYDVSDYCDVDPVFGSLDDFIHLLDEAHKRNIKVVIDQVWSHTSEEHVWFKKSRSDRTNEKADWYVWADPKPDGTPPNNWLSYFGGPAWTFDTRRQQYYLHHFLKEQPALNLRNPEVLDRIKKTGAFWLDMGVDGFRLDVAHTYYYDPELRDNPVRPDNQPWATDLPPNNPMGYQKRIHSMNNDDNLKLIEELRAFINEWPDKFLLAEAGGDDSETVAAEYTQTGKRFHMAYSFGLVGTEMTKPDIVRAVSKIEDVLKDGWVCWATGNHDFKRVVSRLYDEISYEDRARFSMALGLTLRGNLCIYQGEELGLPQAELRFEDLVDPYDIAMYPDHAGRDGCRTPMPWTHNIPNAGFSTNYKTWLPLAEAHVPMSVDLQESDETSVLNAYKNMIAWRKENEIIKYGDFHLLDTEGDMIAYKRMYDGQEILCVLNAGIETAEYKLTEASEFNFLENMSYHVEYESDRLVLQPFGYAILQTA